MKTMWSLVLLLVCQACVAEPKAMQHSDKVTLSIMAPDGTPENWVGGYAPDKERGIVLSLDMDIPQVKIILVSDVNAMEGQCGKRQREHLFFLRFESPSKNKKLSTRIDPPCLVKNSAVLKLQVETQEGKRYFNTVTFTSRYGYGHTYSDQ
jgi:hypothetical protein